MNIKKYTDLNTFERIQFIGKLTHCVQNDEFSFDSAEKLIVIAELHDVFKDVIILPEDFSTLHLTA